MKSRHGLSYTTFALSGLEINYRKQSNSPQPILRAVLDVKNTGTVAGSEVLQLYIKAPNSIVQRPIKELHGFEKVFLRPGEEKVVRIGIDPYATSFWDESEGKWCSEKGIYKVMVTTGSGDILEEELSMEETRFWIGL
jgi:beta-glucosidase